MAITWHIAADIQLFVFSPIFIIVLYHFHYVGLAAIVMTILAATATIGYVSVTNGYWAAMNYNPDLMHQVAKLYVQPIYRAPSSFYWDTFFIKGTT